MEGESTAGRPAKRQRASRAGQAKRFECPHSGCGKRYSRAEHLHRHELNHKPKEVFRCEEPDCGHTFVRPDLFARHKARHEALLSTRPSDHSLRDDGSDATHDQTSPTAGGEPARSSPIGGRMSTANSETTRKAPHISTTADVPSQRGGGSLNMTLGDNEVSDAPSTQLLPPPSSLVGEEAGQANDNFAAWLFESPGSHYDDFNITNFSFLDFGLEYSPQDTWNLDGASLNAEQAGLSSGQTGQALSGATPGSDASFDRGAISEPRHTEVISMISLFAWKQRGQRGPLNYANDHILFSPDGQTFPNLTAGVLDNLMANYWLGCRQVPIVHQATFSNNSSNILLLLAMIALGANGLTRSQPKGVLAEYREFGDLIITHLRWEIFTDNDAQPPVQLWAAQALLLVEFYEKQCSTRKLHERAHIHHASTLTLLRRGSPLVGKSGSESPSSEMPTRYGSPVNNGGANHHYGASHADSWWIHWVRNESFNRVVFSAFQMDTLHAVMFGHAADMAANEIRLCMPCDESLWRATSAVEVQRLEANMKMYGIRPVNFLDGLKRNLHAHEVHTHAPARILLMAGLLSVGWHISRREKHLQFLETVPSIREQGRWRSLLLQAFGHWRSSFEQAAGAKTGDGDGTQSPDMNAAAPAVLFHLAHMTMHGDIIDIQIYSGSKRLLGRKVSRKDYLNVVQRVKSWAATPVARHAVLHAMKLLHESLLRPNLRTARAVELFANSIKYNARTDPLFYRPWGLYLASLIVWAYQHARRLYISNSASALAQQQWANDGLDEQARCCQYLTMCAAVEDPTQLSQTLTVQGCASVLAVLSRNFEKAEPDLLIEASKRLQECRSMILMNDGGTVV